jgi:outer membrane lipoprotein-sorting protein
MTKVLALSLALLAGSCAIAQTPPTLVNPVGAPAASLQADSSIEQILDALHTRGQGLQDFTADLAMAEIDALSGDTTTLNGKAWYQAPAEGQGRLRVLFDSRQVGQRIDKTARQEYLLDDGWLIERDYRRKIQIDRQVLKPGQKMNLLKLGEGPFPLPIGQPREEVLRLFEVKKAEAKAGDPANTVHLDLIPRPETQFARRFKSIAVWVDTQTHFPRKIETIDTRETSIRATDLTSIRINSTLDGKVFVLDKIGDDWRKQSEALEE